MALVVPPERLPNEPMIALAVELCIGDDGTDRHDRAGGGHWPQGRAVVHRALPCVLGEDRSPGDVDGNQPLAPPTPRPALLVQAFDEEGAHRARGQAGPIAPDNRLAPAGGQPMHDGGQHALDRVVIEPAQEPIHRRVVRDVVSPSVWRSA